MERIEEGIEDTREIIKGKLRQYFDGKIVRKDHICPCRTPDWTW